MLYLNLFQLYFLSFAEASMDNKFTVISWNIGSLNAKRRPSKQNAMSIEARLARFSHINPNVVSFQESWWQDKYTELNLEVCTSSCHFRCEGVFQFIYVLSQERSSY